MFGLTSATIGHPIDTIKTKMQVQDKYAKGGAIRSLRTIIRTEGVLALWRGLSAPLVGSAFYRSLQFGAYSSTFAALRENSGATTPIPFSGGLQPRVLIGGVAAGTTRALLETPLELIKVRRQTGQAWRVHKRWASSLRDPVAEVRNAYRGFGVTWLRASSLLTSFFIMADSLERHYPAVVSMPGIGPFVKGGLCATAAWWVVWPLELLKSQVQAGDPSALSLRQRVRSIVRERGGLRGLYRGIGPGTARSIIANGSSMVIFTYVQGALRAMDER